MNALPRISLVTVNFNYGRYLGQTLDSVLSQGYPDLEYLVLDGGSTDSSVAEIEARADRLAYWHSRPDAGQAAALNEGLRRCSGEVVGFLNSDDLHLPDTLHTVGRFFAEHPYVHWLGAPCETIDGEGRPLGLTTVSPLGDPVTWVEGLYFPQPSAFWRRSLHAQVGWFEPHLSLCFDQEFWARLALAGHTPVVLSRPLSRERLHDTRKTADPGPRLVHERLYIAAKFLGQLPPAAARRLRRMMHRHERNLLRAPFHLSPAPSGADLARLVWQHPDLLRDRATWGLLRRHLTPFPST